MATFSFDRFLLALKCHFLVERNSWMRLFGIYTLVMFMANLFFTRVQGMNYGFMVENWDMERVVRQYNNIVGDTVGFGIVFFCFAMLFCASFMFSQMKDTRKRSAYLLWPVSNVEKYVVSFLYSVVFMTVLTVAAYVLADGLRVLTDWLTGRIVIWGFPKLAEFFSSNAICENWQTAWMFFAWVFYFHSLYIVGGTLFRRQQFLMTSAVIVVVGILLIMTLNQVHPDVDIVTGTWDEKTRTYTQVFHPAFYILTSVLTLLIFFHYWVSYNLFTRIQVINNKWLNV